LRASQAEGPHSRLIVLRERARRPT
jgi:hypothetical protein